MRWFLIIAGLSLQLMAVIMYLLARWHASRLDSGALVNLTERTFLKPPFLYLAISSLSWGTGVILMGIFSFLDSDPVLFLSQVSLAVIGFLILFRFKI